MGTSRWGRGGGDYGVERQDRARQSIWWAWAGVLDVSHRSGLSGFAQEGGSERTIHHGIYY